MRKLHTLVFPLSGTWKNVHSHTQVSYSIICMQIFPRYLGSPFGLYTSFSWWPRIKKKSRSNSNSRHSPLFTPTNTLKLYTYKSFLELGARSRNAVRGSFMFDTIKIKIGYYYQLPICKDISLLTVKHNLTIVCHLCDIVPVIVETHVAHEQNSTIRYDSGEFAESCEQ